MAEEKKYNNKIKNVIGYRYDFFLLVRKIELRTNVDEYMNVSRYYLHFLRDIMPMVIANYISNFLICFLIFIFLLIY